MGSTEPADPARVGSARPRAVQGQQGGRGRDRRGRALGQPGPQLRGDAPGRRPPADRRARTADDGTTGDAARPVTLLQMVAVLLAGLAAGTINTVVGVGDADHVPDPARVRRTAGDRQRVEHDRPGARSGVRGLSATGASCSGQRSRAIRLGVGLARSAASSAPSCCSRCPSSAFARDRPGPDRARAGAGRPPAADLGVGRRAARGRSRPVTGRGGSGRRSRSPVCTAATSAPPRA